MVKVLLVDDERGVLDTLKLFLERGGMMEVDCASSAQEAMRTLGSERYDVVVSDYMMPGMDGIELLKTLRNTGNTIPFVLLTGRGREDVAMQALNEGADFYIQKSGEIVLMTGELKNMILQSVHRDQAEKAERQARQRFELFTRGSSDMIYRMQLKPSVAMEYMSPSVELFVGYTADEFYKDPGLIFKCIHPDDMKPLEEAIVHPETYDGPVAFRWIHKDGSIVWAEDVWVPVRNENGDIVAVDGISRDITTHVATEEALKNATKRLALLGRMIKHDALNQLALIQNTAEMAMRNRSGQPNDGLARIIAAAHIIKMQLEFSGYELDEIAERPTWITLKDAVDRGVSLARPDGLSISTDVEDVELPGGIILARVLSNLIEDSMTHGEKAKYVRISTKRDEAGIDLIYADDGVGIEKELKERIFEKGFGKRTGYGLYLSREVLALSGISIREDGVPGSGARFVIHIPNDVIRRARK
ncbi:MAG: response regulator [Thermoplasmata archaeon]|jgi:PAS domain S-box-containing protein|nr:response regulator [Thermoplasmata archaeon]